MQQCKIHGLKESENLINNVHDKDSVIQYKVPWFDVDVIEEESFEMI